MAFKDGTVKEAFLSHQAFMQLVRTKAVTCERPAAVPANGQS